MPGALIWQSDERCVVGETTFQSLPLDLYDQDPPSISMEGADFMIWKRRPLIEAQVELLKELRPRNILELGMLEGGGTALLLELARPRLLVAIDQRPPTNPALRDYVSRRGLDEVMRIHDDVDQADRRRLAEIAAEAFGDQPLDLVVDDCSHMYEATRASFNELFPRLRPGGVYMIEDWAWAHQRPPLVPVADMWADQVPLTRLILELVLTGASAPALISEITINAESAQIRRGDAELDSRDFDIVGCPDARGRDLLARDERVGDGDGLSGGYQPTPRGHG
jgi:SAM-dependent methyltransferase